ncbi:MAG TPA: outer membrane protein assembly factor BamE [Alphaproteobacteria bacterium]|nr:outer membrane protein assembly factor BamE [Alphaproteobacteria bacterium]
MHYSKLSLVALVALCLAACTPVVAKRGNMVSDEALAQVKVNESTREDVAKLLGTPTQTATFDDKTWYYIGQETEKVSFFDPEITDQKIVAVQFTPEGKVSRISRGGRKYAEEIEPNPDKTPTYGKEVSLMQQLLGNLGRPTVPVSNKNR